MCTLLDGSHVQSKTGATLPHHIALLKFLRCGKQNAPTDKDLHSSFTAAEGPEVPSALSGAAAPALGFAFAFAFEGAWALERMRREVKP